VAGVDEAKNDLVEIVEFLKDATEVPASRRKNSAWCAASWTSGNWVNPAGSCCGWRGEVWPFFSISGSEFVEVLVGVGGEPCA